jgi:hypothetical protein
MKILVPEANALEKSILDGACIAQKKHKSISGGWWLWHGPESFLQVMVALQITKKTRHTVYVDTSMSRIQKEIGKGPGQPAKNVGQRPDLSVWSKASDTLRAIIEIKRSNSLIPIRADVKKMERWLGQKKAPNTAYVLAYSEAIKKRPYQKDLRNGQQS